MMMMVVVVVVRGANGGWGIGLVMERSGGCR